MILKEFHDFLVGGHASIKRTLARIAAQYFWKGMAQDVQQYVKNCIICQQAKYSTHPPTGLMSIPHRKTLPWISLQGCHCLMVVQLFWL